MNYGICIDGDVMVSHMYSENVSAFECTVCSISFAIIKNIVYVV
jgi:hypothetical protein